MATPSEVPEGPRSIPASPLAITELTHAVDRMTAEVGQLREMLTKELQGIERVQTLCTRMEQTQQLMLNELTSLMKRVAEHESRIAKLEAKALRRGVKQAAKIKRRKK
jgi:chromosome segregation ATPase